MNANWWIGFVLAVINLAFAIWNPTGDHFMVAVGAFVAGLVTTALILDYRDDKVMR
jgi:hypothetical protein